MCLGQPDKCERQCKYDVCSNPLTAMATSFLRSPEHRWSRTRGRHGQPFSQRVLRKCTMPFVLPTIHRRKARHVLRTARQVQATVHMWPVCSNPLTAMRRTRILEQPQAPEDLEPEDLKDTMVVRSVAGGAGPAGATASHFRNVCFGSVRCLSFYRREAACSHRTPH